MKRSFLGHDTPIITAMVQATNPDRVKELVDKSLADGAQAFGMQFEKMKSEYRNEAVYRDLFGYTDKPIYVTNYRDTVNDGKSDDVLAEEMMGLADCGATLCDVVGDLYDRQPDELAVDEKAVAKQMKLIDTLHKKGAEVLISSHICRYTPAERVLEVALQHKKRGADISKIVTNADTMEQQIENLRIIDLLKRELGIPFLFLAGGHCRILRRIGGEIGCCMYLCVHEHDELATAEQPLITSVKAIRENL